VQLRAADTAVEASCRSHASGSGDVGGLGGDSSWGAGYGGYVGRVDRRWSGCVGAGPWLGGEGGELRCLAYSDNPSQKNKMLGVGGWTLPPRTAAARPRGPLLGGPAQHAPAVPPAPGRGAVAHRSGARAPCPLNNPGVVGVLFFYDLTSPPGSKISDS
jgi:hypothetical protein